MKTAFFLYKDFKPKNDHEVLDSVVHFCAEHCLSCHDVPTESGSTMISIDGEDYVVSLKEEKEEKGEKESVYWVINCLHKSRLLPA